MVIDSLGAAREPGERDGGVLLGGNRAGQRKEVMIGL